MISSTWAAMLALGSGLGGIVTAKLGVEAAFLINAATYVVSAVCIATVPIPAPKPGTHAAATAPRHRTWRTFVQGMRYMQGHPQVRRLLSVKAWSAGVGGSIILLSTLFAEEVYEAGVTGIGSLYMVRGVGAVCGPILARGIVGEDPQAMSRTIGVSFFIMGGLYALFSRMPTLQSAAGVLCVATMASNVLWVFSSTLLQVGVPDVYRGRVFATDFALLTIVMALSTLVTGWTLDHLGLSPRTVTLWLGVLLCLPGLLWLLPAVHREARALSDNGTAESRR